MDEAGTGLLAAILERGDARKATGDDAWVTSTLRVEIAPARTQATLGVVPAAHVGCDPPPVDTAAVGVPVDAAPVGRPGAGGSTT